MKEKASFTSHQDPIEDHSRAKSGEGRRGIDLEDRQDTIISECEVTH